MKKLIYPVLGLALMFSVQSCMDNYKAKYLNEKTLADDNGITLIKNGIEGGMTEIAASKIALKNSQNPQVVSLAQMMITDHSKANNVLDSIKDDKLLSETDTISGEHKEMLDSLQTKTGPTFDKAYITMMIHDHKQAIDLFKDASDNKNETIQDFVRQTLPTLEKHLEMAKDVDASLK
jgi:putative membrane protein